MLEWLIHTALFAAPFVFPIAILMFVKRPGFSFPWRAQSLIMPLFFVMYVFSLLLFISHAYALKGGVGEFFEAFWGNPLRMTPWCFAGYMAQILSIAMLALVLNWGVVRQLNPKLAGTKPLKQVVNPSDKAVDAIEGLQQRAKH